MSGLESGAGGFEPEDSEGQSQLQLDVTPAMRFFAVPVVLLIVPAPLAGLIVQVTVVLFVFPTVAENCSVPPP